MSSSLYFSENSGDGAHDIRLDGLAAELATSPEKKDGRSAGEERAIASFKVIRPLLPKEGLLVPVFVIDEEVERIEDRSITDYVYDRETAILPKPPR